MLDAPAVHPDDVHHPVRGWFDRSVAAVRLHTGYVPAGVFVAPSTYALLRLINIEYGMPTQLRLHDLPVSLSSAVPGQCLAFLLPDQRVAITDSQACILVCQ